MNKMNLLFKVISYHPEALFSYLSPEDHVNLSVAFMDDYIVFLLDKLKSRKSRFYYDCVIKRTLETINVQELKSSTLNLLHRGFWNHISSNCRLKEKFVYKWSTKINMLRFKINNHCIGRIFSQKFKSRFPGFDTYKPCLKCFDDTDYHYKSLSFKNGNLCTNCSNLDYKIDEYSHYYDYYYEDDEGNDYDYYEEDDIPLDNNNGPLDLERINMMMFD
jgi:hypothetical protein